MVQFYDVKFSTFPPKMHVSEQAWIQVDRWLKNINKSTGKLNFFGYFN